MELELKNIVEDVNKTVTALREANETKADKETVARIETALSEALSAKSALETRLSAMETAANRPGLAGKSEQRDEYLDAFVAMARKASDYGLKSKVEDLATKQVNIGTGANGGFAVPSVIAQEIARVAKDFSPVRNLARVVTVGTQEYKEILSLGGAAGEWLGEADTHNVTNTPTLKDVKPTFGEIAARAQATNWSLEDMFFDVQSWLALELGDTFAQMEGAAFVSGNGTNKPTGLLNGTAVSTVASGAAAAFGANPYDNIIDLINGVKGGYRANGNFLMNSKTFASLVKVKDTTGAYLFPQNLSGSLAQTILGFGVHIDENMPDVAAGAKPILFGDFNRGYLIADRIGMAMLINPYKLSGVVEFEARKRVGGIVKDAAALKALEIKV